MIFDIDNENYMQPHAYAYAYSNQIKNLETTKK